jgi:uncharacterized protein
LDLRAFSLQVLKGKSCSLDLVGRVAARYTERYRSPVSQEAQSHIVVRKPALRLSEAPRYYLRGGNPLATHFFNALNLLFPDGERFFVKAVHDQLGKIDDPRLRADARAFALQEGQHAKEHQAFFAVLEEQGYPVSELLGSFHEFSLWCTRNIPAALRLSMTAGAEHYTATLGALVLETGVLDDCDPVMRELITWHAIEEIEHKSVAFDVLRATHPGYALRVAGFCIATTVIGALTTRGLVKLVAHDRIPEAERLRHRAALRGDPKLAAFRGRLRKMLLAYFRPSFHPTDVDDQHLIAEHSGEFRYVA